MHRLPHARRGSRWPTRAPDEWPFSNSGLSLLGSAAGAPAGTHPVAFDAGRTRGPSPVDIVSRGPPPDARAPLTARAWRRFVEARHLGQALGPSSSLRAMLESGATPLVRAIGFEPPRDVERLDTVLIVDASGRRGKRRVDRRALGRTARSVVAHRHHACHVALHAMVRPLQRHAPPADRRHTSRTPAGTSSSTSISPPTMRRRSRRFRTSCSGCPPRFIRWSRNRNGMAAGVCRSLKDGVLSASADVLAALVRPAAGSRGPAVRRLVRAGADDRLPHPLPALCRGARARAVVASGVSRQLQHRRARRAGRTDRRQPADSGRRFARLPASPMPAARPATFA